MLFHLYQLNYIMNKNRMIDLVKRYNILKMNIDFSKIKNSLGIDLIYILFQVISSLLKKVFKYGIIIPCFVLIFMKINMEISIKEKFLNYYAFAVLFFQIALRLGKSKILSAEVTDFYLLKIFRADQDTYIKAKKNKALLEAGIDIFLVASIMLLVGYHFVSVLWMITLLLTIELAGNSVLLLLVHYMGERYIKIKYILVILLHVIIPFMGFQIVSYFNLKFELHNPYILAAFLALSVLAVCLLYRNRNSHQFCRIIIKQYYYDNAMLESLDGYKISDDVKNESTKRKEGFEYLNQLFFSRHKSIIRKDFFAKWIFVIVLAVIFGKKSANIGDTTMKFIFISLPFLIYELSISAKICKMFYCNCDNKMLKQSFYNQKSVQSHMTKIRLKSVVCLNLVMGVVLLVTFHLLFTVGNGGSFSWRLLKYSAVILPIFAAHGVFDVLVYSILRPYDSDFKVRTPLYYIVKAIYIAIWGIVMSCACVI